MDKTSSGIVLLPANGIRKKTAILDQSFGRIECIASQEVCAGAIISYRLKPFVGGYFVSEVAVEYIPFFIAVHDVLFLHHVLEICYFFIPIGSCIEGLFDIIHWIYAINMEIDNSLVKKYAIIKLLTTLGVWPERHEVNTRIICKLVDTPIDRIALQDIHLASEREFDQWLRFCILQHPFSGKLQTIGFLSQGAQE